MTTQYLLAIDQGTTNSRAIIFNRLGQMISQYEVPLAQSFPKPGWVEQDPEAMVTNTVICCQEALKRAMITASDIVAIGISNQRETTIVWDKRTGKPIYPAIVWQDRRTAAICKKLKDNDLHEYICKTTGLLLDPYFSATKLMWLLEHVEGAQTEAEKGNLLFGTVDTFLIWKLTNQASHVTDATNASRTLLFNVHTQEWDPAILKALGIPPNLLPRVLDNADDFGFIDEKFLGIRIPIAGVAGDQQAATIGQACFKPGMVKATYGTGGFLLLNTGKDFVRSHNQLLTTIAYRLNGEVTYGLEGSIFSAGETVKWLRDKLKMIHTAAETEEIAASVANANGTYLVPAFTGLGAPYWDPEARAAIIGIERSTSREHIVRAALESVAYQTKDLLAAMSEDQIPTLKTLRLDGGMVANNWFIQFLSDILGIHVERPVCIETSALGVAYLAGLKIGIYESLDEIAKLWQVDRSLNPNLSHHQVEKWYEGWKHAVHAVIGQ